MLTQLKTDVWVPKQKQKKNFSSLFYKNFEPNFVNRYFFITYSKASWPVRLPSLCVSSFTFVNPFDPWHFLWPLALPLTPATSRFSSNFVMHFGKTHHFRFSVLCLIYEDKHWQSSNLSALPQSPSPAPSTSPHGLIVPKDSKLRFHLHFYYIPHVCRIN